MEETKGMEAKRSDELGWREKGHGECYGRKERLRGDDVRMWKFSKLCI